MNTIENGNNPVEPDEDESQQQNPEADLDDLDDEYINSDSILSEIENDEVPDLDDQNLPREFPRDDSHIGDNPIYPNEEDIVPKNDRIPPGI